MSSAYSQVGTGMFAEFGGWKFVFDRASTIELIQILYSNDTKIHLYFTPLLNLPQCEGWGIKWTNKQLHLTVKKLFSCNIGIKTSNLQSIEETSYGNTLKSHFLEPWWYISSSDDIKSGAYQKFKSHLFFDYGVLLIYQINNHHTVKAYNPYALEFFSTLFQLYHVLWQWLLLKLYSLYNPLYKYQNIHTIENSSNSSP